MQNACTGNFQTKDTCNIIMLVYFWKEVFLFRGTVVLVVYFLYRHRLSKFKSIFDKKALELLNKNKLKKSQKLKQKAMTVPIVPSSVTTRPDYSQVSRLLHKLNNLNICFQHTVIVFWYIKEKVMTITILSRFTIKVFIKLNVNA